MKTMTRPRTLTKAQFIAWLTDRNACPDAREWARKQKTARAIVKKCRNDNWLLWLIERVEGAALAEYQRVRGPALRRALTWKRVVRAVKP